MERGICPFLGLQDDPSTSLDFPSEGNYCHHARPVSPINGAHQEKFCLVANHTTCPVFQASAAVRMPAAFLPETTKTATPNRRFLTFLGIPALITSAALAVISLNNMNANPRESNRSIPNTGPGQEMSYDWSLLAKPKNQPDPTKPPPPSETPTAHCPQPVGWTSYIVAPTDSLYRLSVIYGVSVGQLLEKNCLGNKTAILPQQVLFVPDLLANTPEVSSTATPLPVQAMAPPSNHDSGGNNRGDPTHPPSADQPTGVPPSNTPLPRPTNTPQPPVIKTPLYPTATSKPRATKTPAPPDATAKPPDRKPDPPKVKPTKPSGSKEKDKGGSGKDKGGDSKDKGKDKGGKDKGKQKGHTLPILDTVIESLHLEGLP